MIDVPHETSDRLALLRTLVIEESGRQNLISPATVDDIDRRHISDSLQLLPYLPRGVLVDIGTGAGFPGLVLACCRTDPVHLVEPRSKRAAFLDRVVSELGLTNATVWGCKVERLELTGVSAITARAVAALDRLFNAAETIATPATMWVLPKGRSAQRELDTARLSWQGQFRLVPSATDPDARIVLASNVHRRLRA